MDQGNVNEIALESHDKSSTGKTTSSYKSNVRRSCKISTAPQNRFEAFRPTICWTTEPIDYIQDRYITELGHMWSKKGPNTKIVTAPYLDQNKVRLVGGKLIRGEPYRYIKTTYKTPNCKKTSCNYTGERLVPIKHFVGNHQEGNGISHNTQDSPKNGPRDALTNNGVVLHFIV